MDYYIKEDELITFSFGGVSSDTFSLYVTKIQGLYNGFERDIEFIEVKGRDGDIPINNNRRKSKDITVEAFIDVEKCYIKDFEFIASEIENWLQGEVCYNTLVFSNYEKPLKAICINQISIDESIKDLGEVQIKFRVQPN